MPHYSDEAEFSDETRNFGISYDEVQSDDDFMSSTNSDDESKLSSPKIWYRYKINSLTGKHPIEAPLNLGEKGYLVFILDNMKTFEEMLESDDQEWIYCQWIECKFMIRVSRTHELPL